MALIERVKPGPRIEPAYVDPKNSEGKTAGYLLILYRTIVDKEKGKKEVVDIYGILGKVPSPDDPHRLELPKKPNGEIDESRIVRKKTIPAGGGSRAAMKGFYARKRIDQAVRVAYIFGTPSNAELLAADREIQEELIEEQ